MTGAGAPGHGDGLYAEESAVELFHDAVTHGPGS